MQIIEETQAQQQKSGFATDHDLKEHIKCSRSKVWQLVKDDPNFPQAYQGDERNDALAMVRRIQMGKRTCS